MNMKTALAMGLAALLLAACAQSPAGDAAEPIKIGAFVPLTGDFANVGQNVKAAMVVAEKEINDQGGINGRPLELVFEDDKCNGKDGNVAANKLYRVDNVPIAIGPSCSGAALAAGEIAESEGRVLFSNCASNPAITNAGDYIFRDYPSDAYAGKYAAEWLYAQGYTRIATFKCLSDYCVGITDVFEKTFETLGGEIVAQETHEQGARDFRAQLAKLKDAEPEILYFISYTDEIVLGFKQIKEMGWDVQIFGADTYDDPSIPAEAGQAAEGAMWDVVKTDLGDDFKAKMLAQTGKEDITVCTPQAYDAVNIVAKLMREGAMTPEELKAALYAMPVYHGVSGPIEFDENGDVIGAEYVIKQYKDGKLVVIG